MQPPVKIPQRPRAAVQRVLSREIDGVNFPQLTRAYQISRQTQGGIEALEGQDPLTIKAYQYDLVCNGFEIASGSIRNHKPETMVKAFEITGLTQADVEDRFGGMYRAFQYGAPPHGGMAAGIDRIIMLLAGATNLREVALFPMNQQAVDLLMGAPAEATPKQLREAHLRINAPEKNG